MAARRAEWKGYLKISLVTFPVRAYVGSGGESSGIRFHQLHAECHSRIRYTKTCPIHGEVSKDEIVLGYKYKKGQYVEVDPSELASFLPEGDRSISVETFIRSEAIDPAFLAGKTYYLVPDGKTAEKPYKLIATSMESEGLHAVGRMMITTREHIVRMRPDDDVLAVDLLEYASEVRTPADFKKQLGSGRFSAQESKLTRQLISSMTAETVDLRQYADEYTRQVKDLIESKIEGKEIVTPARAEEPRILNLMDALKKSMTHKGQPAHAARRKAHSVQHCTAASSRSATRRRKSG